MIFILKQTGIGTWCIYSPKGHTVTEPRKCNGKADAIAWANAWISSFSGARLEIE